MSSLIWGGSLLVAASYYLTVLMPPTIWTQDSSSAEAVAAAMLLLQKAAVVWCLGPSGCPDGPVPATALLLPPGYAAAPWVAARAGGGWISTYVDAINLPPVVVADRLNDLTQGGPSAGIVSPASTVIARDRGQPGRLPVPVAAGVPVGVPVVSQKVR